MRHPIQPVVNVNGVHRFKENQLVSYLFDFAAKHGVTLNEIAMMPFSQEDYEQCMQLIGYSVCGICDLGMVSERVKDSGWQKSVRLAKIEKEINESNKR